MTDLLAELQALPAHVAPTVTDLAAELRDQGATYSARHFGDSVLVTDDFRRIRDLPRRRWQELDTLEQIVDAMTQRLRTPTGKQRLKPAQAVALLEAYKLKGAFLPIRAGYGKTLVALLLGRVLGLKRVVYLCPAAHRAKMLRETEEYAQDWRVSSYVLLSYEQLSQERLEPVMQRTGKLRSPDGILTRYQPQLIIADEADSLKNPRAACTVQVREAVRRVKPTPMFVPATGTPAGRGLPEFWHLIRWALGTSAPVPTDWREMQHWSAAMDEKTGWQEVDVGALPLLCDGYEVDAYDTRTNARRAFGRRLVETQGVVATGEDIPTAPLAIETYTEQLPLQIVDEIKRMKKTGITLDDQPLDCALSRWAKEQELATGMYLRWDPPPPKWWVNPRKDYYQAVRAVLEEHPRVYSKPSMVATSIDAGHLPELTGLLTAWRAVKDKFRPNSVPVWLDKSVLDQTLALLERNKEHMLVWVGHRAVGHYLAEQLGWHYFGEDASDARTGAYIADYCQTHTESVLLSSSSTGIYKGQNLQKNHHKNLFLHISGTGKFWEQALARTHRDGQTQPVTALVRIACEGHGASWEQANRDAAYVEATQYMPQKLVYGSEE